MDWTCFVLSYPGSAASPAKSFWPSHNQLIPFDILLLETIEHEPKLTSVATASEDA